MKRERWNIRRRLAGRLWPVSIETEIDEEIGAHIELHTKRLVRQGWSEGAAVAEAHRRFGNMERVHGECGAIRLKMEAEMRRTELLQEMKMDLAFALRTYWRTPLLTVVILLTIALAVGANAAIFSVIDAVLLRPLPYREANRAMLLWNSYPAGALNRAAVAVPEYFDLREQLRAFDDVAAVRQQPGALVAAGGEPEAVMAYAVTPNLFRLLGAEPVVGRGFGPGDGAAGAERVMLISHALWSRRFGSDPAMIGRQLTVGGQPGLVIGVMPPAVRFPDAPMEFLRERADLWIASDFEQLRGDERGNQFLGVIGRTREGVSRDAVRADLDAVEQRFRDAYADRYAPPSVAAWRLDAVPMHEQMVGAVRPTLLALAGSVLLILLIACVNIANLLLARGAARQREMAIRLALGAGRLRLLRQVLTECGLLAFAGGALGVALAWLGIRALVVFNAGSIPRFEQARLDGPVLAFSLLASALTGALIGLVPALQQSQTALRAALGDGARTSRGGAARRTRNALIIAQVAMAFVVLIAAGLLGRSLLALQRVPSGFEPRNVLALQLRLPRAKYDSAFKIVAVLERLQAELRTIPGAEVSAVYPLPMSGDGWSGSFVIDGDAGRESPLLHAEYAVSAPGYFRTMRIPLLEGRDFSPDDRRGSPSVVIVDEALARQHWPGQSAIGRRLNANGPNGEWADVIGVVRHVRNAGPREDGEGQIYFPVLQRPQRPMALVVRSSAPPASIAPAMRAALRAVDAELPASRLDRMDGLVTGTFARDRFNTLLIAVFAFAALVLPSVGLYGVMASAVSQRTHEIAIRMALGGRPLALRWMVMREGLLVAVAGMGVGVLASLALGRALTTLLFEVAPTDAPTYAAIALLLLLLVVVAANGPARRATRIDPMLALRE